MSVFEYDEVHIRKSGSDTAIRLFLHSFTDADIWMKNKEKAPFSRGAYYVVRNPQERVPLTQLFAK